MDSGRRFHTTISVPLIAMLPRVGLRSVVHVLVSCTSPFQFASAAILDLVIALRLCIGIHIVGRSGWLFVWSVFGSYGGS